jgi:serine phosphatase RsbU (regulator of sigma subunit)
MSTWDLLTGDADRDRRNVAILMESVEELYGPRELVALLTHAVDRAIRVTGAQRGILLLESGPGKLAARVARTDKGVNLPLTLRYSRSVVEKVWTSGTPHLTVDAEDPASAALGQSIVDLRLLSIMAVPLPVKSRSLGVLYVDSRMQAKEFTKSDFAVFKALGGIVALAVEDARLAEAQKERQRLQEQMDLARTIQQGLLPRDIASPAGFDIAGEGKPCEDTSGDYYDVIPLSDGRYALVMGDVSGHGLGPALFMASTRAQVHALLHFTPAPERVLKALNGFLARDLPRGSFMSLFLGLLDPAERTLVYASAGHSAPLWVRAGGRIEELAPTGPVLGPFPEVVYRANGPLTLETGDVLTLFTDGLFEAKGPNEEMYGDERLQRSVVAHATRTRRAAELLQGVYADLVKFCGTHKLDDDVTCLVLRVAPSA